MSDNRRQQDGERGLDAGKPLKDLLEAVLESRHSRFPMVGDGLDDVEGILHAKDLLPLLCDGQRQGLT